MRSRLILRDSSSALHLSQVPESRSFLMSSVEAIPGSMIYFQLRLQHNEKELIGALGSYSLSNVSSRVCVTGMLLSLWVSLQYCLPLLPWREQWPALIYSWGIR